MRYIKKVIGSKIYLSPINIDDFEIYAKWINDFEVAQYVGQVSNLVTFDDEKEYLTNYAKEKYNFAIVKIEDDTLIGGISLKEYNPINGTAELGIFIGDKDNRHKGYGTDAIKTAIDYGFKYLRLNNIMLNVFSFNENAIRMYEKIGFKKIGTRHKAYFFDGKLHDVIYMEYVKEN